MQVKVGLSSCGVSAGAQVLYEKLSLHPLVTEGKVRLIPTGCIGMCYNEPLVEVIDQNGNYLYGNLDEKKLDNIIESHLVNSIPVEQYIVSSGSFETAHDSFFKKQVKIVLGRAGTINPESIDDYIGDNGYKALEKALKNMSWESVITEVKESGLRGRGGGGFPTGLKWSLARKNQGDKKYVICNADEGDPGAFMDRSTLEGDPHSILEGMTICAYAIGADEGYIYVRAEYPKAVQRLRKALEDSRERGFLGQGILGTDFNFDIHIKEGAGAFVCGEETALIASIEGKRGMPVIRPPFPAEKGLWGKPTNINNVETYANIPWIILNGAREYAKYGTEKSRGTKVFAMAGKIKRSGLVEVPMGITINEIVYDICDGIAGDRKFKAVQMGGPSGGCIPARLGDTTIDYESITATGAIMGSGGLIVMDEDTCMVEVAKYFLSFTQKESCGKCTFCRIGTKRMEEILQRITEGRGEEQDLEILEKLASQIKENSLCGLGQTAPNPVLTTLRYFREEYEEHIYNKKCPAKSCKSLITFKIVADRCVGCTLCSKVCPVDAISGEVKKLHMIDQSSCIKCGKCLDSCRFSAIIKE